MFFCLLILFVRRNIEPEKTPVQYFVFMRIYRFFLSENTMDIIFILKVVTKKRKKMSSTLGCVGDIRLLWLYRFYSITRPSFVALSPSIWKEFNTGFSRSMSERIK